jgi:hypothetical protein
MRREGDLVDCHTGSRRVRVPTAAAAHVGPRAGQLHRPFVASVESHAESLSPTTHPHRPCPTPRDRYAEPEWTMEQDVESGKLHGSMWGIKDKNDPDGPPTTAAGAGVHFISSSSRQKQQQQQQQRGKAFEEDAHTVSRRMLH